MKIPKYKIGDRVVYDGLIGVVESISEYPGDRVGYNLVAEENKELSTSAMEDEVELYVDQELDQDKRLLEAELDSKRIQNMVHNFKEETRDIYD